MDSQAVKDKYIAGVDSPANPIVPNRGAIRALRAPSSRSLGAEADLA